MTNLFRFSDFELDLTQRQLRRAGAPVPVGSRAFDLLATLVERGGALVTKGELLDRVWPGLVVEEANVQVQASGLRKILGAHAIATVPGLGYRFALAIAAGATTKPPATTGITTHAAPLRPLIGRDDDLDDLCDRIAQGTLVSLVGPGGIGKTQLGRAASARLAPSFRLGACWVDLSALSSAEHLLAFVAGQTGVQPGPGDDAREALVRALADREMLLVLDNCEHVVAEVGALAYAVLAGAPAVRVLATSQVPLDVVGERIFRLDALALPASDTPPEHMSDFAAVELLVARARAVERRFELAPQAVPAVIELLHKLDGLPLAIEMAAAWLPKMGAKGLVDRLSEWPSLLRGAVHGLHPRQRTLGATLDWSHSLLSDIDRKVLRRLSVCVGMFGIDTASEIACGDDLETAAVLDALGRLVDKSLVHLEQVDPPRYRLLETMRSYAAGRLRESSEEACSLRRHVESYAHLGRRIEAQFWNTSDAAWLAGCMPDYNDLQVAFERACDAGLVHEAARIGAALQRIDHLRSLTSARKVRAASLFAMLDGAGREDSAWIWTCINSHNMIAVDAVPRLEAARRGLDAWRLIGDGQRLHFALGFYANECARAGDFPGADRALAEAATLVQVDWPVRRRMWEVSAQAGVAIHRGDPVAYRAACRAELALADVAGAERAAAAAWLKLADAALMAGELAESVALGRAAVDKLRHLDQPSNLGLALSNLCSALVLLGDTAGATIAARESLPLLWRNGWGHLLLDSVALIAARQGRLADACRLLAYTQSWYAAHDDTRQPNEAKLVQLAAATIGEQLAAPDVAAASREGQLLSDGHAEHLAMEICSAVGATKTAASADPGG